MSVLAEILIYSCGSQAVDSPLLFEPVPVTYRCEPELIAALLKNVVADEVSAVTYPAETFAATGVPSQEYPTRVTAPVVVYGEAIEATS